MNPKPRIFISAPIDRNLSTSQQRFKKKLLDLVKGAGFEPQEFHISGLPKSQSWNFSRAAKYMKRCHGAVVLAFAQWQDSNPTSPVIMPTEYNHFEGALALAFEKELLVIKDEAVASRGITYMGGGQYILSIPSRSSTAWFKSEDFQTHFSTWVAAIRSRYHVFFGYSGGATDTANRIIRYLKSIDVKVRDWQTDFRPAGTILDEIEESARTCLGGIFLFSKDDELVKGDTTHAAPRDNVVFEAGYFMNAVGRERTLIIREDGAKMPADVGGGIYLSLQDRNNTATIETALRQFIDTRI